MSRPVVRKLLMLAGLLAIVWLGLRYLLPLLLPFLLGIGLALAAEPLVGLLHRCLRLPRGFATAVSISGMLALLVCLLVLLGSVLMRQLEILIGALPDLESTFLQGMTLLEDFLIQLAAKTSDGIRPLLTRSVLNFFSSGTALIDQAVEQLPKILSGMLVRLPDGALMLGTSLLSAFMISARLPELKASGKQKIPETWRQRFLPMLRRMRQAVGGWLKAQVKLSAVTFCITALGLLLLQIPYAPIWAVGVAVVDAVPLLGTGTVLLPWALVCLLRNDSVTALGLVAVYAVAALTRSAMEPRLVGRQLGLDPLVTLVCLYIGYQLWGVAGILLAPMVAVAAVQAVRQP